MEQIGRFNIIKRLGAGGFGEVFLGEDATIERQVAIKVFRPKDDNIIAFATSSNTEGLDVLRTHFVNEARILASLEHEPHIINIIEFGELEDGSPWYAMPYIPENLTDKLGKDIFDRRAVEELADSEKPKALALDEALETLKQIISGLATAHQSGLIHRDINPSNILLPLSGQVQITGFGIAKAPDGGHFTVSHLGMGSRNYMAPEQRESAKHVDARADVYSVGVMAYRMLTGRLPTGRFSDPNVQVPALSQALNDCLLRAMEEDAGKRFKDAGELKQAFEAALTQQETFDPTPLAPGGGETVPIKAELRPLVDKIRQAQQLLNQLGHTVTVNGRLDTRSKLAIKTFEKSQGLEQTGEVDEVLIETLNQALDKQIVDEWQQLKKQGQPKTIADFIQRYPQHRLHHEADKHLFEQLKQQALQQKNPQLIQSYLKTLPDGQYKGQIKTSEEEITSTLKQQAAQKKRRQQGMAAAIVLLLSAAGGGYYQWDQSQIDDRAWSKAQKNHQSASYQSFIANFPQSEYAPLAENALNGLDNNAFKQAQSKDSIEAYQQYLKHWPRGQHRQQAQTVIENIAWTQAQKQHSIKSYNQYLGTYPDGRYIKQAKQVLLKLEDNLWAKSKKQHSEKSYRAYLNVFPKGRYAPSAGKRYQRLKQQREAREAELAAWTQAKKAYTYQSYAAYLKRYPKGKHAADAQKWKKALNFLTSIDIALVNIQGGQFMMGSNHGDSDEKPVHKVTLKPFRLMSNEVTFNAWDACVSDGGCSHRPDDKGWGRGKRPVIYVSYKDITQQFIPWLNKKTGMTFRLPSEAEWEYAARAGSSKKYSWGNAIGHNKANCAGCGSQWDNEKTAPVKSFAANAFGLYDMHGNVWEIVQDCWNNSYSGAPSDGSAWRHGDCSADVRRGGSRYDYAKNLRSAYRNTSHSNRSDNKTGFRLAQDLD